MTDISPLTPDPVRAARAVPLIEAASGALARQVLARLGELDWFAELGAWERSTLGVIVQGAIGNFAPWLSDPDGAAAPESVLWAAPPGLARTFSLEQTVVVIRTAVSVAESSMPDLAAPEDAPWLAGQIVAYSRELAFGVARVYARAAERRASFQSLLEGQIVDRVATGNGDPSLTSRAGALGWGEHPAVRVVVGAGPPGPADVAIGGVTRAVRSIPADVIVGLHGRTLVVVLGSSTDPVGYAATLAGFFGDGPVVVGRLVTDLDHAHESAADALAGLGVCAMWPEAPRPVLARDLLLERTIDGDPAAVEVLLREVYEPLAEAGDFLLRTLWTYLESGLSYQATARQLHVHQNTVRYRLGRVTDTCGYSPVVPREAMVLRLALARGRREHAAVW